MSFERTYRKVKAKLNRMSCIERKQVMYQSIFRRHLAFNKVNIKVNIYSGAELQTIYCNEKLFLKNREVIEVIKLVFNFPLFPV